MNKPEGRATRNRTVNNPNLSASKLQETPKAEKTRQSVAANIPTLASMLPTSVSGLGKGTIYRDLDYMSSNHSSSRETPLPSSEEININPTPLTPRAQQSKVYGNKLTVPNKNIKNTTTDNPALTTPNKNIVARSSEDVAVDSFQTPTAAKLVRNRDTNKDARNTPLNRTKPTELPKNTEGDVQTDTVAHNSEATSVTAVEVSAKKIQRRQQRNRDIKFTTEKTEPDDKEVVVQLKNSVKVSIDVPKVEQTPINTNTLVQTPSRKYQPRGRATSENPQIKPQIKVEVAQPEAIKKVEPDPKSEAKPVRPAIQRATPKKQQLPQNKLTENKSLTEIKSQSKLISAVQTRPALRKGQTLQNKQSDIKSEASLKQVTSVRPVTKKQTEIAQTEVKSQLKPKPAIQSRQVVRKQEVVSEKKQVETKNDTKAKPVAQTRPTLKKQELSQTKQPELKSQVKSELKSQVKSEVKSQVKSKPVFATRLPKKQQPTVKQTESILSNSVTTPVSESQANDSRVKAFGRRSPLPKIETKVQTQSEEIKIPLTITPAQSVRTKTQPIDNIAVESPIKAQESKQILKKTTVVLFTIKRLFRSRVQDAFAVLKLNQRNRKVLTVNQSSLLLYATERTVKNKEGSLIKLAFSNIKKQLISLYANQHKKGVQSVAFPYKGTALVLLDKLFRVRLRQVLFKLSSSQLKNRKVQLFIQLQRKLKRKLTETLSLSFNKIRQTSHHKINLLNKFATIISKSNKTKLVIPFNKLILNLNTHKEILQTPTTKKVQKIKPKQQPAQLQQTDNQQLIEKLSQLKSANTTVSNDIASLETKLRQKKRQIDNDKNTRTQKIAQLKQQNQHIKIEIQIKKHRGEEIKTAIEAVDLKPDREVLLEADPNDSRDTKLALLTSIYISNYKNPEQVLRAEQLRANFGLEEEDGNAVVREWRAISENTELKRLMASYENSDPKLYKARTTLIDEQVLVGNLIKSYLKQQYFWSWIHLSALSG